MSDRTNPQPRGCYDWPRGFWLLPRNQPMRLPLFRNSLKWGELTSYARLGLVVIGVITAACTKANIVTAQPRGNAWTHHGILRIVGTGDPYTLNPIVGDETIETELSMFWAGYLFLWSDKNEFVPDLATQVPTLANGGISKDGLRITYHLRKRVKWQDGAPFSADDVIFTWEQVMNPRNDVASRTGYDLITAIDEPDDYTIVVHLKRRYAPFVATFFASSSLTYCILPKHILDRYPDINRVSYNDKPIGTGPFTVAEYERGSLVRFVANSNYWRGPPRLHEIQYRVIPNDATIAALLQGHEADMAGVPTAVESVVRKVSGITVRRVLSTSYDELALNLRNPILADRRVRQALAYDIDTGELIQKLQHGVPLGGASDQTPFLWAYDANVKHYDYEPAKAEGLLEQAGWRIAADGYRYKNGQRLRLTISADTSSVTRAATEVILQQTWRKIGIDALIKNYAASLFLANYGEGGILENGKFDIGLFEWVNGIDPDDATLWMCDQFPPAGQNIYYFCNHDVDATERVALSEYDQSKRKLAYDKIQRILADEEPMIVLWYTRGTVALNTDIKNYRPALVTSFWNSWEWEI